MSNQSECDFGSLNGQVDVGADKGPPSSTMGLTPRGMQILELVCDGLSNEEIAQTLHIQTQSVKFHLKKIYGAFDVDKRHTAIIEALKAGLVRPHWISGLNQASSGNG